MFAAQRPQLTPEQAAATASRLFGIDTQARALPSERDQNFRLTDGGGAHWVLKISNGKDEPALLEMQHLILECLEGAGGNYKFPSVQPTAGGELIAGIDGVDGTRHLVRLLGWVPGRPLALARPHSPSLLAQLGRLTGTVSRALAEVSHPAAARTLKWDLRTALPTVRANLSHIDDRERRHQVAKLIDAIEQRLRALAPDLRVGLIHNDANDYNVLVDPAAGVGTESRVRGLIDVGDALDSWLVAEPAVAIAYAMLGKLDLLAVAAIIASNHHAEFPLLEAEIEALFDLATLRLCLSVANTARHRLDEPDNEYLSISEIPAWEALDRIAALPGRIASYRMRAACGLEPCGPAATLRAWLEGHADSFAPVVEPALDGALVLDLSVGGTDMGNGAPGSFTATDTEKRVFGLMKQAGTTVGIGRYDEARCWYGGELFAAPADEAPRRRTVHLGIDLFLAAGAAVHAPLAGTVVSAAVNAGELDYGPTVILEHQPEGGPRFFTLYGHLTAGSIAALVPGQQIAAAESFATIGPYPENGNWAPHLHLQLIVDRLGFATDFPGVAAPDEKAVWLSLSPDPNLLLGIDPDRLRDTALDTAAIAELRARHIGPSLSISYQRPIHVVRGFRQFLYDAEGQPFLDAVNNVPHVGHSHPKVVAAAAAQNAVLNTNTRYWHKLLVRYAERLVATLPDPLEVCYFVCSGSEANELAVRLARTATGRRDMVVLDGAYHGNTSLLIEMSPYKHDGPGGAGAPDWVHVATMPDPYRGRCRADDEECGANLAEHVREACEAAGERGVAGFMAEPLLGCGGQVIPPPGYLAAAFEHTRTAGGICIADEVQIGFGRAGTHFWAFESQGAVPDVVTLGKPIGNGFPLAVVVTTREIADAFANGMEYFNTFGGNPVACAVGLAVLDVIEQEGLQENARLVGERLLAGLRQLESEHTIVGNTRGLGLYLGAELVRNPETLEPATEEASYVINRMRDHGILVSTDGPLHNVIKIKPPLCFDEHDADRLVETLEGILREDVFSRT